MKNFHLRGAAWLVALLTFAGWSTASAETLKSIAQNTRRGRPRSNQSNSALGRRTTSDGAATLSATRFASHAASVIDSTRWKPRPRC